MARFKPPDPVMGGSSVKDAAWCDPDPGLLAVAQLLDTTVGLASAGHGWGKVAWLDDGSLKSAIWLLDWCVQQGDRGPEQIEPLRTRLVKLRRALRRSNGDIVADLPVLVIARIANS